MKKLVKLMSILLYFIFFSCEKEDFGANETTNQNNADNKENISLEEISSILEIKKV